MKFGSLLFALFVFVVVVLIAAANSTWQSRTAEAVARLESAGLSLPDSAFSLAMLEGLPAPVARYLRAAIREGTPLPWHAEFHHEGGFRADTAQREDWEFRSVQHFNAFPPAFVWDARVRMPSGAEVFVRDALVGGEGSMLARIAGIVPVADARGAGDATTASLHRWLAETAWFPTALLPGQAVTWSAIDDSTARATATTGEATASLDFHFGPDSLVAYVETGARARAVGRGFVPTPWRGTWSDWRWRLGMRVPLRGEVGWLLPSGPFTYWRGTLTEPMDE